MRFIPAFLVMVLPSLLYGQTSVKGVVKDHNGSYLPGASIVVPNSTKGTVSDTEGKFYLAKIPGEDPIVVISYLGFKEQRLELKPSMVNELTVVLEEEAFLSDALIVTAIRADNFAPVTHVNVVKDKIAELNTGRDVPYILSQTPSLVTSSDAGAGVGYSALRIRGIDQASINVTINGIALNDAESQNVYWVNLPDFSSNLSSVQLQRGVGSSTNGPASFGASINMLTDVIKQEAYAGIDYSYGSFNTMKTTLLFGTGLMNGHWTVDGRLSGITSEGYIDRASSELFSYYLSTSYVSGKTSLKLLSFGGREETYQAWYGVDAETLKNNRTMNFAGAIYNDDGNISSYYKNEVDHYSQDHLQLHLNHQLNERWLLQTAMHYTYGRGYFEQYRQNDQLSPYPLTAAELVDTGITTSDVVIRPWLDNHYGGMTFNAVFETRERTFIVGGAANAYSGQHFGRLMWTRQTDGLDLNREFYRNNGYKVDVNSYLKFRQNLGEKLQVYADIQYRHIEYNILGTDDFFGNLELDRTYNFFNPKLGITFALNGQSQLYSSTGASNREPSRNDLLFSDNFSATPERLWNQELGYRFNGKGLSLSGNVFYMHYLDQLVPTGALNDVGEAIRENVGRSYRLGIELSASVDITPWLRWMPNLTLSENRNIEYLTNTVSGSSEDTPIAYSPSIISNNALQAQLNKSFRINMYSSYVDNQNLSNTGGDFTIPSYHFHDVKLEYHPQISAFSSFRLYLMVYNILDEQYLSYGYVYYGDAYFFPQAGRNFMAGISFEF
ncbi:MAG: TonB-dependent receptor [Vicingaceae bacterium]